MTHYTRLKLEAGFKLNCTSTAALDQPPERGWIGNIEGEKFACGSLEEIIRGGANSNKPLLAKIEPFAHAEDLSHPVRRPNLRQVARRRTWA